MFAPCAIGAVLNPGTIPLLQCAAVAGSANNQLQSVSDADALHERGILYAPDYVVNAGGAIAFGLTVVTSTLESAILFGELRAGSQVPSDDDLAAELANLYLAYLGIREDP